MAEQLTQEVLAARLRAARLRAGLSQRYVEDKISLHRSAVSDVERGHRSVDCLELKALAEVYGETLEYFLGGDPRPLSRTEQLAQALEKATVNLQGYIERQARELAEPLIALAEQTAAHDVDRARHELLRERDMTAELRLQLLGQIKRAQHAEHQAGAVHKSGDCETCARG